jgi:hypothetical protein
MMHESMSRKLRPLAALALGAALCFPSGSSAQTAVSTLLGTWNAAAGSALAQVIVAGGPGAYTIDVKGTCTPTPCDWGTRPLTIYGASAGATVGKVGSATYNQGFATRIVVVTAQDAVAPFLKVDVYTKFTGAGRSNYVLTQTFHP